MHDWLKSRHADLEQVRSWRVDPVSIALHIDITNALHDWLEGRSSASEAVASIMSGVDRKPQRHMLNTASAWYRRFRDQHAEFEAILELLSRSRHATARVQAAFDMRSMAEGGDVERFRRLLSDRSAAVRNEIVSAFEMRRWRQVVDDMFERGKVELDLKISRRIRRAIELVVDGFISGIDDESGEITWYTGEGRGGANALTFTRGPEVSIALMRHVREQETRYWAHAHELPFRPKGYDFRPNILWDWKPAMTVN